MSFDWNKYFDLAVDLRKTNEEAYIRSAISRSYYCAFNTAKYYLKAKNRDVNTVNHDQLWSQVRSVSGNLEIQVLGQRVKRLRKMADYDSVFPKIDSELVIAMVNTTQILQLLKGFDHKPDVPSPKL